MSFEVLKDTYALALPESTPEAIDNIVRDALARAREKHADFDRFLLGMEFLATVFFTDHRQMPLDDFIETLYCGVKHGDFSRNWRAALRKKPPAAPEAVQ